MAGPLRVLVVGGGRVGAHVARLLDDRGHDIVVIERDPDIVDELSDEYVATIIQGDATRPSILEQVGLDRIDVVTALTGNTGTNLAVCMAVSQLAPEVWTVMRTDHALGDEYHRFVDAVVFPERAGARAAVNSLEHGVRSLEDVTGNLEIMEIEVVDGAPVSGRSLTDVALPRGSLVVSDADGERIAGSEMVLEPGRSYIVAAEPDVSDEVLNLMRGGADRSD
ncbi:potassium channel family protein [Halobaculum rarum]|uniref:potassium channel family protein n=1 Tax=Halobaculum rarum TaxID=3075122 RepID=UPI0032AE9AEA